MSDPFCPPQEKLNGSIIKQWIWCGGAQPCEERDAVNIVTKRFFGGLGEQVGGTNYFYCTDHLGSVREMTDSTGAVRARYDYDPYGRITKVSGDLEADFGFTGFYLHQATGLNLTKYRAYDANLGRWLSRDPIGEDGGINLYGYCSNSPFGRVDPYGLQWQLSFSLSGVVGTMVTGFIGGGVNVGITSNGQVFIQVQEFGISPNDDSWGGFAGVGFSTGISHSACPVKSGTDEADHLEVDAGFEEAIGGSIDHNADGTGIGGIPYPRIKGGGGFGAMIGAGKSTTTTFASPSLW